MAKSYRAVAQYPSSSNPSKVYTISVDEEGALSCNCPAWTFKRGTSRTCKHVEDYMVNGGSTKVPVAVPEPVVQATDREKGGTLTDLFAKLEKGGLGK